MATMRTKSGKRVTKRMADELAREAEKGYDLSKARRIRVQPGRPSLEAGVSPRISYRVPRGLYNKAKKTAERQGRTVSDIAREALEQHLTRSSAKRARR